MKYQLGWTVYVAVKELDYTNAIVCGYEWGGDNKKLGCREEWFYYIRPSDSEEGHPMVMIRESQITDRISV